MRQKKHVQEHLLPLRSKYLDFEETRKLGVKSHTIEEFESRWAELKEKYHIEENSWLSRMYDLRAFWAKSYLKDAFFVGLTTCGRSESIHALFDSYINANTMLNDFVWQYDKALMARRATEEETDFVTMNSRPTLMTDSPIEEAAAKCYTKNMFDIFMKEWKLVNFGCAHEKISKVGTVTRFKVGLYKMKVAATLPERYILKRWTINARFKFGEHGGCQRIGTEDGNHEAVKLWTLQRWISRLVLNASDCPSTIAKIISFVFEEEEVRRKNAIARDTREVQIQSQVDSCVGVSQIENAANILIRDPTDFPRHKGRPKNATRIKSGIEIATNAPKRRKCSYCHTSGHYATGCAIRKAHIANNNTVSSTSIQIQEVSDDENNMANGELMRSTCVAIY